MSTVTLVHLYFQIVSIIHCHAIIVDTNYGRIEGEVNSFGINTFQKVPFAKPPINNFRWSSPQEPDSWSDILDTKQQNVPACLQGCSPDNCAVESEDCLYLNIYTPSNAQKGSDYQTLIFLFPGAFDKGFNDDDKYDPSNFINNVDDDIIIVTPNYRVGILGFLYDNTFDTGLIGNYGFQDQALAIKWVYRNIENFGGDKDNIVLFGESSGALSVALHLLYNNANIKAGIMQSPSFHTALRDRNTWYDVPAQFSNLIGCNATSLNSAELLNCWLSTDGDTILQVQLDNSDFPSGVLSKNWAFGMTWTPTAGTNMIPTQPINEWKRGEIDTPPFMVGTNKDEFYFFTDDRLIPYFRYDELFGALVAFTGSVPIAQQILNFYNITSTQTHTSTYLHDLGQINTDNWQCSVRNVLGNLGKKPKNIYYYNFDVINEDMFENVFWAESSSKHACWTRNCHFTDIFYLFTAPTLSPEFDEETLIIGKQLQTWWTNYAITLDPNQKRSKSISSDSSDSSGSSSGYEYGNKVNINLWPKYSNKKKKCADNMLQILNANEYNSLSSFKYDPYFCEFWDQIGYAGNYSLADMSTVYNALMNEEDSHKIGLKTDASGNGNNHFIIGIIIGCSLLCIVCVLGFVIIVLAKNRILKDFTPISTKDDVCEIIHENEIMCTDTGICVE